MKITMNNLKLEKTTLGLEPAWQKIVETDQPGFIQTLHDELQWTASNKWANELKQNYTHVVVLGIGGSSMGGRALAHYKFNLNVHFLDNIDPSEVRSVWITIQPHLEKTAFILISKSGDSLEVMTLFEVLNSLNQKKDFNLFKQCYLISEDKKSLLTDLALQKQIPLISMPENVGGRFSVMTTVGMVLAGFMDYNLSQIRTGALSALAKKSELLEMASELIYAIESKTDLVFFWAYSSQLRWFNQWLAQLWAESLGKTKTLKNTNSPKVPWLVTATGCSDQHSIFQQILESEQKKYVILTQSLEKFSEFTFEKPLIPFFKNQSLNISDVFIAEREATTEALKEYRIPCADLIFNKFDDQTIGFLFTWFEILTVLVAAHFDINPYDQPAVALGKTIAKAKLKL